MEGGANMQKSIVKAIKNYACDNGFEFESHAFINDLDTVNDTCVGVYLQEGQSIMHMLQCVEKTVLCSSKDANLRADLYTLLQHRTKQVSPGTVLIYFPNLPSKILDEKAFNKTVSVDYGIPLTERDKVFRNALDRYIRRFGEGFPMLEFTGSMSEAIECMNSCVRKGQRYVAPLYDKNGNPILYQQNSI